MEETTSNIQDSKEGVGLLATVTSIENQIKIMGDNINTPLDVGGVTAKEGSDDIAISINALKGELQSTGDMLRSSQDPSRKYNQGLTSLQTR